MAVLGTQRALINGRCDAWHAISDHAIRSHARYGYPERAASPIGVRNRSASTRVPGIAQQSVRGPLALVPTRLGVMKLTAFTAGRDPGIQDRRYRVTSVEPDPNILSLAENDRLSRDRSGRQLFTREHDHRRFGSGRCHVARDLPRRAINMTRLDLLSPLARWRCQGPKRIWRASLA